MLVQVCNFQSDKSANIIHSILIVNLTMNKNHTVIYISFEKVDQIDSKALGCGTLKYDPSCSTVRLTFVYI